ncbi:MAG: glycosyltransferase family 61 protein [Ferruginibacter sp.]
MQYHRIIFKFIPHKLIRSVRKKLNLNYFFFGPSKKNIGNYLVEERTFNFELPAIDSIELGVEVAIGFNNTRILYQKRPLFLRKYVLEVSDCVIEPLYGWGIEFKSNKLIFDSISNNGWLETYYPSYKNYKKNKDGAIFLEAAASINLTPGGDKNYWHFLHDILGQIVILREFLKSGIPVIISKELASMTFFKDALQRSAYLKSITWIVRETGVYFRVGTALFLQRMPNDNAPFLSVRQLLEVPQSDQAKNRRIFLSRSKNRIRHLRNNKEVEELVNRYGFEVIDADSLSLDEQIILLGETRYIIGIHGAGLTNVLFRNNAQLSLLEILPADYIQPHYFWLAKGIGHHYIPVVGSAYNADSSFSVDIKLLGKSIESMLA